MQAKLLVWVNDVIVLFSIYQIIRDAERLASRMKHRGACGFDNDTGDGAGVMVAIPHSFYKQQLWVVLHNTNLFLHSIAN